MRILMPALLLIVTTTVIACTTFCQNGNDSLVFGKNYDWNVEDGHILINPRGLERKALLMGPGEPMQWTVTHGSITFNQYGRDFPNGGMNEAGLVIEVLWLAQSRFPREVNKPVLEDLQWIQYQLDTSATIEEVITSTKQISVRSRAPIHFMAADRTGATATFEFLNGQLVVHSGEKMPEPVLANHTYAESVTNFNNQGITSEFYGKGSLERFARAAQRTRKGPTNQNPINYAFATLDNVAQGSYTQWSIVYDQKQKVIHFKTRSRPKIKFISMKDVDFKCGQPALFMDLNKSVSGNIAKSLEKWTPRANLDLIERVFPRVQVTSQIPRTDRERIANWPREARCATGK